MLSLNAYPHTFSLHSVGVITGETRTLSSPFPPAVRCAAIRFLHAEGQSTAEIHCQLCCVYGDNIMSDSCVSERCRKFRDGRGMLTKGIVLLHGKARPHTTAQTNALIKLFNREIFDHPPYSPDLAPSDYHLFTNRKIWLATQRFHTNEEIMDGVTNWLHNLAALFFDEGLQKLVSRYDKFPNVDGNYV